MLQGLNQTQPSLLHIQKCFSSDLWLKKYSCPQCGKSFTRNDHLKFHFFVHSGGKLHKCTQCNYSFTGPSTLKKHIKRHTKANPYRCNLCDYRTTRSDTLKLHKRTHSGGKPHRCTICEYSSVTNGHLKAHVMKEHTEENPFDCNHVLALDQGPWRCTRRRTHGKGHIDAQGANIQALQVVSWKFKWRESIHEKGCSNVINAIMLVLNLFFLLFCSAKGKPGLAQFCQ